MDLYERANDLQEIIDSLKYLVDEIHDKEYIDMFNEIRFEAEDELNEIEEELYKIEDEEQKELEREYNGMRL